MCEQSALGRPFGRLFDPLGRQVAPQIGKIGALRPLGRLLGAFGPPGRRRGAERRSDYLVFERLGGPKWAPRGRFGSPGGAQGSSQIALFCKKST